MDLNFLLRNSDCFEYERKTGKITCFFSQCSDWPNIVDTIRDVYPGLRFVYSVGYDFNLAVSFSLKELFDANLLALGLDVNRVCNSKILRYEKSSWRSQKDLR